MAHLTTMTSKGQVTIPKEVRNQLGLKPGDQVRLSLENGQIVLRKSYASLAEVVGSLPPLGMPIEEAIDQAKEERARRLIAEMRRS